MWGNRTYSSTILWIAHNITYAIYWVAMSYYIFNCLVRWIKDTVFYALYRCPIVICTTCYFYICENDTYFSILLYKPLVFNFIYRITLCLLYSCNAFSFGTDYSILSLLFLSLYVSNGILYLLLLPSDSSLPLVIVMLDVVTDNENNKRSHDSITNLFISLCDLEDCSPSFQN